MKLKALFVPMTFIVTASSLGGVPKRVLTRGHKSVCVLSTLLERQQKSHISTVQAYVSPRASGNASARSKRYTPYSWLRYQRTLSAAASNDNGGIGSMDKDVPIRRDIDYDNDFFAPVEPKVTVSPKSKDTEYGFFDNSDHVFDREPDAIDDDVAAFRARYQRPIATRSRNSIPPALSEYDDSIEDTYEENDNWFGDTKSRSKNSSSFNREQLEGGTIVKTSAKIIDPKQSATSQRQTPVMNDVEGDTIVRTSSKIFQPEMTLSISADTEPRVVRTSARILPKGSSETQLDTLNTMPQSQQPYKSRNIVPSFMEPEKTKVVISANSDSNGLIPNMAMASNGSSSISHATTLLHQMEHLTSQIYQLNNGVEFNIDSPKQVSLVLFGEEGKSTNKDALEALASTGNQMAACIYKYRKVSREYKRELKRMEQMEKGGRKNDYYGNLARHRSTEAIENSSVLGSDETENTKQRREPLLLIDTSAYIFRSYHAIPPLHHSDGTPTGALHGVCRMLQNLLLNRLLRGDRPRVVLAFDSKGDNFRHQLFPEYKANRGPCPEDLIPQFELVREAADAFGIVQVQAEGYEADDVIATLAKRAVEEGVDVDILSGDKDLMQLITPSDKIPSVHMIDPMHFDRVSHDDVLKKWGVPSEKLGDVLALAGDSSDNIPGAPGIGPKIAAALIEQYGTLDALIEQADSIKQKKRKESLVEHADKVLLYRKLVALDDTIPASKMTLPFSFESVSNFRMSQFDPSKLVDFYTRLELNACKRQLENRLRSSWIEYKEPPSPEEYEGVPF